jgi:hypothetical protein
MIPDGDRKKVFSLKGEEKKPDWPANFIVYYLNNINQFKNKQIFA